MKRTLTTRELTEAAVLADISVLLVILGFFLPIGGVTWALAVVPFAALRVRHRIRTVLVGALAGASIAFLALGPGLALQILGAGVMGSVCGRSIKSGWGLLRTLALSLAVVWTSGSVLAVAFLSLVSATRELGFKQARVQWAGTKHFMEGSLRFANAVANFARENPLLAPPLVLLPAVIVAVAIPRAPIRGLKVFRSCVLALYIAACCLVDVWAGAWVLGASAVALTLSIRTKDSARSLVRRVWIASTLAAVLVLAVAHGPFARSIAAQWPWTHAHLTSLIAVIERAGNAWIGWFVDYWYFAIPVLLLLPITGLTIITRAISRPVLHRIERAMRRPDVMPPHEQGTPGPVPARLENIEYRYTGAATPALDGVSLEIPKASYVGIVGNNGSGKSTLARILAGTPPTSGRVVRPGVAALGAKHGTAIVFQRPESQVLGVRVRDDVEWGLLESVDVDTLLTTVGLRDFADRETSTLSGGELQRLAIAAALAREPALLISDESTAMVDPAGRHTIIELFRELTTRGITVVHITHRTEEVRDAAVVYTLRSGALVS